MELGQTTESISTYLGGLWNDSESWRTIRASAQCRGRLGNRRMSQGQEDLMNPGTTIDAKIAGA